MGRNGSGKSSLLWALHGAGPRQAGTVRVAPRTGDESEAGQQAARRGLFGGRRNRGPRGAVALVPQTPADLLHLETVAAELAQADRESGTAAGHARGILDRLAPGIEGATHPRDLSEGRRLALVLAVQLAAAPSVVLLDEPTRGLDYPAKQALTGIVNALAAQGRTVVISTHDVEFAAAAADRVAVMAEGEIVADGPTAQIIVSSPAFAPQPAKILAPLEFLTVDQIRRALAQPAGAR
jgi:energy-coupling factor transport system ATP-binding protein